MKLVSFAPPKRARTRPFVLYLTSLILCRVGSRATTFHAKVQSGQTHHTLSLYSFSQSFHLFVCCSSVLLCISTLLDGESATPRHARCTGHPHSCLTVCMCSTNLGSNHYTKLMNLRDERNQPVFESISVCASLRIRLRLRTINESSVLTHFCCIWRR